MIRCNVQRVKEPTLHKQVHKSIYFISADLNYCSFLAEETNVLCKCCIYMFFLALGKLLHKDFVDSGKTKTRNPPSPFFPQTRGRRFVSFIILDSKQTRFYFCMSECNGFRAMCPPLCTEFSPHLLANNLQSESHATVAAFV